MGRTPRRPIPVLALLRRTLDSWSRHDAGMHAAAIAFFALLSMAPVLLLILWIANVVLAREAARARIVEEFARTMGGGAASAVQALLGKTPPHGAASLAGIGGAIAFLGGATATFVQLQSSLNRIWGVARDSGTGLGAIVRKRLLSFALVILIGFLLLVSLALSAAITALADRLENVVVVPARVLDTANLIGSVAIFTALFGAMFRFLPDIRLPWRDVGVGAFATALLVTAGKWGIGLYLGRSALASTYGAAASLVVILLWIYYAALLVLFGAAFTRAWSEIVSGRQAVPEPGARRVELAGRAP